MASNKIVGYKKIFGFILPDWVSEKMIRSVAAGLLTAVVMMLVLIFVIWPNYDVLEARVRVLETSRKDLETLRSSDQGLERIKIDLPESQQQKILAAMPSNYSPDEAIYSLRRISADTGVSIISYTLPSGTLVGGSTSVGPGEEMVNFVAYPIKLTVAAPVEALLAFIAEIESSLPFGVVSDLNLQEVIKLVRNASDKTVQLAMEIRFYQAVLQKVNINKLEPLSEANLELVRELLGYNYLVPSDNETSGEDILPTSPGNVFGF